MSPPFPIIAMVDTDGGKRLPTILADGRLFTGDTSEVGRAAIENGSGMRAEDALIIIGGLITLISLISLIGWLRQQKLRPTAGVVFLQVARRLRLSLRDYWLLRRIGQFAGHPSPLALLMCPGTLGASARQFAHHQPRRRAAHTLSRAASVRRHVFGPPAPSSPPRAVPTTSAPTPSPAVTPASPPPPRPSR